MLPEIKTLDVDGALREAEEAVAGDSRADFFRKAAIGGGAVVASGSVMGMLPQLALGAKPSKKGDAAIANFALTLEYLEAEFYRLAVKNISFEDSNAAAFARLVAAHEATHVKFLKKALGKAAVKGGKFEFGDAVTDESKFLQTAFALENTGVHAYLGQAANILQKPILVAAATIVTTEARHAAGIAAIIDRGAYKNKGNFSITPEGSFDVPKNKKAILKAAGPFVKKLPS